MAEHTALGEKLARLREPTHGYVTPADGCASYRSLYERLAHLEADTRIHGHLENNVLFPAALVEAVRDGNEGVLVGVGASPCLEHGGAAARSQPSEQRQSRLT